MSVRIVALPFYAHTSFFKHSNLEFKLKAVPFRDSPRKSGQDVLVSPDVNAMLSCEHLKRNLHSFQSIAK